MFLVQEAVSTLEDITGGGNFKHFNRIVGYKHLDWNFQFQVFVLSKKLTLFMCPNVGCFTP